MRFIIFYSSQNIIMVIKSRMVRWTEHVARMGDMRNACKILFRRSEEKSIRETYTQIGG